MRNNGRNVTFSSPAGGNAKVASRQLAFLGFGEKSSPEEEQQKKDEAYEFVKNMLPGGDLTPLFESENCLLCKDTEKANPREYYALADMGHKEPQGRKTSALGFRVKTNVGSMVPLQIACCSKCRKRHLIASYLKLGTVVGLLALMLIILAVPAVNRALFNLHESLSFILFLVAIPIGWLLGNLLSELYLKKSAEYTRFNIAEIPFVKEMMDRGWFPLYENGKTSRLIFSKKRLSQGWFI